MPWPSVLFGTLYRASAYSVHSREPFWVPFIWGLEKAPLPQTLYCPLLENQIYIYNIHVNMIPEVVLSRACISIQSILETQESC